MQIHMTLSMLTMISPLLPCMYVYTLTVTVRTEDHGAESVHVHTRQTMNVHVTILLCSVP